MTTILSCKEGAEIPDAITSLEVDLEVSRFDRAFANATPETLDGLKADYPYLFPPQYADSVWYLKLQDTLQQSLLDEIDQAFGDFGEEKTDLDLLFKHIRYYFPDQPLPKIVTVSSDVDYNNRVILADTLLLLGLDNYLGMEHRFYSGIDRYIAAGFDKKYLAADVAAAFAKKVIPPPSDRTFLAQMIYYGKELYLKDQLLPLVLDEDLIGYTELQYEWSQANEEQIWRYFVERELLFSTDRKLGPRFLDPAPFSKFRLMLDNESPGRIGRYMGWQIVNAFARNRDVSLKELLKTPEKTIFEQANYKPKK
ncbi:gliding motility lipoprotein GldB [Lentiprolixibacter aurantiacus]|uniref:Gliding motility lipoprotein GldB n=1 Tax=Lentiprolixibacter aurantiacus TaxID=2993939 RepID=A0AAE3SMY0_9FLAO|nr:gliding motility lipoprotein GldB [Lentiprolixibacter aurantiacus]MCX2719157.1 gliding motility lipoprotein GldB [Lentiprolixibacter aurantiacus]